MRINVIMRGLLKDCNAATHTLPVLLALRMVPILFVTGHAPPHVFNWPNLQKAILAKALFHAKAWTQLIKIHIELPNFDWLSHAAKFSTLMRKPMFLLSMVIYR